MKRMVNVCLVALVVTLLFVSATMGQEAKEAPPPALAGIGQEALFCSPFIAEGRSVRVGSILRSLEVKEQIALGYTVFIALQELHSQPSAG